MRLGKDFYCQDAVALARSIIGKTLVRKFDDGTIFKAIITEAEAYCGEEDLACHACKGRTKRTEVMYLEGGKIYVYLIYGMYWLLNFVCSNEGNPQAVLIRGVENISGPGRLGKALKLGKDFYGESTIDSNRLWVEDNSYKVANINSAKRIGIEYAGKLWANKPWRFYI